MQRSTLLRVLPVVAILVLAVVVFLAWKNRTSTEGLESRTAKYVRLAFGPEGKERVWLILDEGTLYLDRSGNAKPAKGEERIDLRELPRTDAEARAGKGKSLEILLPDGQTRHRLLTFLLLEPELPGDPTDGVAVRLELRGQYQQYASFTLAADPRRAAVLHFDGPLTFEPDLPERPALVRGDRPTLLIAALVARSKDAVAATIDCEHGLPRDIHPVAEIEFPAKETGGKPVMGRFSLTGRAEGAIFHGLVKVPEEAGNGWAKIKLSFPDWKAASVTPTTFGLEVVTVRGAEKP